MNQSIILSIAGLLYYSATTPCALAFAPPSAYSSVVSRSATITDMMYDVPSQLQMSDSDDVISSSTQERIQSLVDDNPVLLFMKGSKLFPQCGFSNTACQILQSYNIDFESVDVLADEDIRQGVKTFSQWPTIPQLSVCGEFVGGSDIMIEMYQSG